MCVNIYIKLLSLILSPKYILVEIEVIFVTGGQCVESKAVSEGQGCSFGDGLDVFTSVGMAFLCSMYTHPWFLW